VLPDNAVIIIIGGLIVGCLLIFMVPVYLLKIHPRLDKENITRLNNIVLFFLYLPVLAIILSDHFFLIWEESGSAIQATVSVAVIPLLMGTVYVYAKFTGIKSDINLGAIAGLMFSMIWLITSDLRLAVVMAGTGFIVLVIVFMYHKYTQNSVDLTSPQLMNYIVTGSLVIIAILLSYASSEGSFDRFIGALIFFSIFFLIVSGFNWLKSHTEERK
jgi:hypothetical protein